MNTPTHLAVAVTILGRRSQPQNTKWIIWGALLPDIPMYLLLAFDLLRRVPIQEIFDSRYFQDYWQIPLNIFNSIPLYVALLALAYVYKWQGLKYLSLAALLHIALDFPVHREDAHAHFWPFTNWHFISPVSYWEHDHYGGVVSMIENVILLICAYFGARVFVHPWAKWLYVAVSLFIPLVSAGYWIYTRFSA